MNNKLKKIPKFKTDEEFGAFWLTHDLTDYYDLANARRMEFVKIEGAKESLHFRLPDNLIRQVESRAKTEEIPMSVLMMRYLKEGLAKRAAR